MLGTEKRASVKNVNMIRKKQIRRNSHASTQIAGKNLNLAKEINFALSVNQKIDILKILRDKQRVVVGVVKLNHSVTTAPTLNQEMGFLRHVGSVLMTNKGRKSFN